jgi:hypothetical protein
VLATVIYLLRWRDCRYGAIAALVVLIIVVSFLLGVRR